MAFWNDPAVVRRSPLVTVVLLEWANVQQVARMVAERSAEGQSLVGWAAVSAALVLWANFYRVCCPQERTAFWTTVLGIVMNAGVIGTVVYFRYIA